MEKKSEKSWGSSGGPWASLLSYPSTDSANTLDTTPSQKGCSRRRLLGCDLALSSQTDLGTFFFFFQMWSSFHHSSFNFSPLVWVCTHSDLIIDLHKLSLFQAMKALRRKTIEIISTPVPWGTIISIINWAPVSFSKSQLKTIFWLAELFTYHLTCFSFYQQKMWVHYGQEP